MCGRFSFFNYESISNRFGTINTYEISPSDYINPGSFAPVITRHSPNWVEPMKWGLIPFWAKDPKIGNKMFNARSEGIENKPSFRKPIRNQRCLVPANGFYEWQREGLSLITNHPSLEFSKRKPKAQKSTPYYFTVENQEIFSMAGIYDVWLDAENRELKSFAIITRTANKIMAPIHDRMPVILEKQSEETWLNPNSPLEEILQLLKPYPDDSLNISSVHSESIT